MRQGFKSEHWNDAEGRPLGGCTFGVGFTISWQHGPLGRGDERRAPNGAFVEDVLAAVRDRLAYYQKTEFGCIENAQALVSIDEALRVLDRRTQDRETRGVEGTHQR